MKLKTAINNGRYIIEGNEKYTLVMPPHSNYGIIRNSQCEIVKFYTYNKEEVDRILMLYGFIIIKGE